MSLNAFALAKNSDFFWKTLIGSCRSLTTYGKMWQRESRSLSEVTSWMTRFARCLCSTLTNFGPTDSTGWHMWFFQLFQVRIYGTTRMSLNCPLQIDRSAVLRDQSSPGHSNYSHTRLWMPRELEKNQSSRRMERRELRHCFVQVPGRSWKCLVLCEHCPDREEFSPSYRCCGGSCGLLEKDS
ncbi:hypothetical protein L596_011059 [Steinernema carpocapsae]|uniref:Uncharacterized protein n=1 Tax=Steinernema carpocapsae TaxID=34508 RepID=A0A4U5NTL8_STECR|nr:hypothetical protein L596_011059 [Steinernema carpocapsae]